MFLESTFSLTPSGKKSLNTIMLNLFCMLSLELLLCNHYNYCYHYNTSFIININTMMIVFDRCFMITLIKVLLFFYIISSGWVNCSVKNSIIPCFLISYFSKISISSFLLKYQLYNKNILTFATSLIRIPKNIAFSSFFVQIL